MTDNDQLESVGSNEQSTLTLVTTGSAVIDYRAESGWQPGLSGKLPESFHHFIGTLRPQLWLQ